MQKATNLKEAIKSIPVIGPTLQKTHIKYQNSKENRRIKNARKFGLIHPLDVDMYAPASAGFPKQIAELTTQAVKQTIPLTSLLMEHFGHKGDATVYSIEEFHKALNCTGIDDLCNELGARFEEFGSDKSTSHNYHLVYAALLQNKNEVKGLLEIGLGTNNTSVASNMGAMGRPGASLRAFRAFLPNASIYGADYDKGILFQEDRINTYFVDQTDLSTFDLLHQSIDQKLDLIIDDGLHSPNANIATLLFALRQMKDNKGGAIVIEDIPERALPIWNMVSCIVPSTEYKTFIVNCRGAYMFVCIKS